ncbi:MAG: tRNA (N6-threonylcarbamoyladenosine(37)-N6)-methyltransferase TrmO [Salinivirgaceae bacterium]|nr:tRNA (N6-threonylcarbamoyladenosine(37)-N6)-methyltransferase TrmO [Salinivirgaceae bacterium]
MDNLKTWINFSPIGVIHSKYNKIEGTPIQPNSENNTTEIEIFKTYEDGLLDLDGFSHIILIYYFNRIQKTTLRVVPFMDTVEHGVFATRAPSRPNRIGLSILKIIKIENNIITVENGDIVNQTPVLDIKPYVPAFDSITTNQIGWLNDNVQMHKIVKDDGRFK